MNSFEQQVRERAYHFWVAAGKAEGMAHEHWTSAERAILIEHAQPQEPPITASEALAKGAKTERKTASKAAKAGSSKAAASKRAASERAAKPKTAERAKRRAITPDNRPMP